MAGRSTSAVGSVEGCACGALGDGRGASGVARDGVATAVAGGSDAGARAAGCAGLAGVRAAGVEGASVVVVDAALRVGALSMASGKVGTKGAE